MQSGRSLLQCSESNPRKPNDIKGLDTMLKSEQRQMLDAMFKTMDHSEIMECYDMLGKETRMRRELKAAQNKRELKIGSIVEWSGRKSGSCTGEVIRVKRKKCIVKQTSPARLGAGNWDIPMSMLTVVG
jgi:hypothetical protein